MWNVFTTLFSWCIVANVICTHKYLCSVWASVGYALVIFCGVWGSYLFTAFSSLLHLNYHQCQLIQCHYYLNMRVKIEQIYNWLLAHMLCRSQATKIRCHPNVRRWKLWVRNCAVRHIRCNFIRFQRNRYLDIYPRESAGTHCIGGWVRPVSVWTGEYSVNTL